MSNRIEETPERKADKFRAMELAVEFSKTSNSEIRTINALISSANQIYAATCTREVLSEEDEKDRKTLQSIASEFGQKPASLSMKSRCYTSGTAGTAVNYALFHDE